MAADSGTYDDATIARRQKIAEALFADSMKPQKIEHWAQGLAQLARAGVGGYIAHQANEEAKDSEKTLSQAYLNFLKPGGAATTPTALPETVGTGAPSSVVPNDSNAIPGTVGMNLKLADASQDFIQDNPGTYLSSGVRSMADQARLYADRANNPNPVAVPGTSLHERGMAADIGGMTPEQRAMLPQYGLGQPVANDPPHVELAPNQQPYQVAGPAVAAPNPVASALSAGSNATTTPAIAPTDTRGRIASLLSSSNPQERKLGRALAQNVIATEAKRDPLDIEAKTLDIATKKKALEAAPTVQRVKQTDGSEVAVQWDSQSKQWVPLKAPEGGNAVSSPKLTEQQSKDVGFYNRGQKLLPRLEKQDQALTDLASTAGGSISNYFKTDKFRQAEQTGRELLAVILRKDTGAAVTPQEYSLYGDIYLPRPGDDMATIVQKRAARATAIEGLRLGLGPADIIFRSREAAEAAKPDQDSNTLPAAQSATPQAPAAGAIMDGFRFKGGDPSKRENWEPVT